MQEFLGEMNIEPPVCSLCGARHERQYPHEATQQLRDQIFVMAGRKATAFDLVSHTRGLIREAVMNELLRRMEI